MGTISRDVMRWNQYRWELQNATRHIKVHVEQFIAQVIFEQGRTNEMRQQIERLKDEVMELKESPELVD